MISDMDSDGEQQEHEHVQRKVDRIHAAHGRRSKSITSARTHPISNRYSPACSTALMRACPRLRLH